MNLDEIVQFHREYVNLNTIDHIILHYLSLEPMKVKDLHLKVFRTHSVVTRGYVRKRLGLLEKAGYATGEFFNPSTNELFVISNRGIRILKWLDQYFYYMEIQGITEVNKQNVL